MFIKNYNSRTRIFYFHQLMLLATLFHIRCFLGLVLLIPERNQLLRERREIERERISGTAVANAEQCDNSLSEKTPVMVSE